MPQDARTASATRIAVTLGTVVAAVMLLIWGASALAGALAGDLAPAPPEVAKSPVATTTTEPTTTSIAAAEPTPAAPPADPPVAEPVPAPKPTPKPTPPPKAKYTVVIDAGHQGRGDNSQEPIGPGASETKPKVTSGAAGTSTRQLESEFNLAVALKLRDRLKARGVNVIMVRTSQNVNIANSERAAVANDAKADLFIRIHADSDDSSSLTGYLTLVPGKNRWTGPIVASSAKAGRALHRAAIAATGQRDRGIKERTDMSGFNWAKVPSVIVEAGMLSNSGEDRLLKTDAYRSKLAAGLAEGTMDYLGTLR